MKLPLEGIRVLDLTTMMNGPSGGYQLADLGAEVIKIEMPVRGDAARGAQSIFGTATDVQGLNMLFDMVNRGKRSLTLDLSKQEGKEVLYRLVEKSDVFLTNYRKDQLISKGIDFDTLSQYNTQLVFASTTGYGSRGPDMDMRAYDPAVQAYSGLMTTIGERHMPPVIAMGALLDQLGGTMLAYSVVIALLVRERLGIGQEVETSMLGNAVHLQYLNMNSYLLRGRPLARPIREKARNPLTIHYQCSDDKWIMLSEMQSDRYWEQFCTAIGREELTNDSKFNTALKRRETCKELISILDEIFATKTRDEWLKIFNEKCPFAYAPVHTIGEAAESDQVKENEYIVDANHPILGRMRQTGIPFRFSKTPGQVRCGGPELGQHTEEVLLEFGYSWDEISNLKEEEVI
ncbi:MAG: CaiB/BaiF CoA-transferase family protein [Thermodesulfobacteriota bacterium]|nr:CaiB/BaiF CoA-transferase family protein [Thermodesulfobacteriota bacterium]